MKRRSIGRSTANCWARRKVPRPKSAGTSYDGSGPSGVGHVQFGVVQFGFDFLAVMSSPGSKAATDNGRVLALFDPWQQKAVWPSRDFAAGARVAVVGSEAVGVLEPGGHFVLVALADGRTIADLQLEARPHFTVTDLLVTRMGDQYIVLAHDNRSGQRQ